MHQQIPLPKPLTKLNLTVCLNHQRRGGLLVWAPICVLSVALFFLGSGAAFAICPTFGLPDGSEIVELDTSEGQICLELLRGDAPETVENFLNYLFRGDYDGAIFHRSVPGFVIQGGGFARTTSSVVPIPTDPPVVNEPCLPPAGSALCTERGNIRGTVAMARLGGMINSATNQFFINLVDNRNSLDITDEGFTVFANVLGEGMVVADNIAALPIANRDESWWLAPTIGGVLGELPLQTPVPFSAGSFGCWDPLDLAIVVSSANPLSPLPDPFFGTGFFPLSGGCGTQIPLGSFVANPGPPSCPDFDRITTGVTGLSSLLARTTDPAMQEFLQYEFSCEQATEALNQRALFRNDYGARVSPELVLIEQALYQPVPEPGLAAGLLVGSLCLRRFSFVRIQRPYKISAALSGQC